MSFNVENLFDIEHDAGKDDFTYLPLKNKQTDEHKLFCSQQKGFYQKECLEFDWNQENLNYKFQSIAKMIHFAEKQGPDILILIEVENLKVLRELNDKYLNGVYKQVLLIEGWDARGIDIGILSKLPLNGEATLHRIPFKPADGLDLERIQKTRGILQATFELPNKEKLTILGAHFPSQGSPTVARAQAVDFLKSQIQKNSETSYVIAGGDFNIIATEENTHQYFGKNLSSVGSVSHLVGCHHCEGSHNYKKSWSFLDALIFSTNLSQENSQYQLVKDSITTIKNPEFLNKFGEPVRFDENKKAGVSDHLPFYARIRKVK